jgi:poly-gamma-glutamate synthesis protein (capsule biosynthesis protein)
MVGAICSAGLLISWQQLSVASNVGSDAAVLAFVGDTSFDRHIRIQAETFGYERLIAPTAPLLARSDAVFANLEGPITSAPSVSAGSRIGSTDNMTFTNPTSTPELLRTLNIAAVSLANNHALDYGSWGLSQTKARLSMHGIGTFGGMQKADVYATSTNGGSVALIGYNGVHRQSRAAVRSAIAEAAGTYDVVVVFAHWGEEYLEEPTDRQRTTAALFADAGADLIVGAHPHVLQPYERIGSTDVFYSLGNFLFDQYWEPAVRRGAVLSVVIRNGSIVATTTRHTYNCFSGHVVRDKTRCTQLTN